jgi:hypothetical protein
MATIQSDIDDRLRRGQFFNAYKWSEGGFIVGLGPVTDCYAIVRVDKVEQANHLIDVLRATAGQPACICPVSA